MIEWWQSLVSSVVTGALVVSASIAVWFLNSKTARDAQHREHEHVLAIEAQRQETERKKRRDDVRRERLNERAAPVLEFLDIMEAEQGRRLVKEMLSSGSHKEQMQTYLENLDPQIKAGLDPRIWTEFSAIYEELVAMKTAPTRDWQDVMKQYGGKMPIATTGDLRDILVKLLGHLAAGETGLYDLTEVATLIRDAREIVDHSLIDLPEPNAKEATPGEERSARG